MSDWQPIETAPDNVLGIEGSHDGKTFAGLYNRYGPGGPWYEYDDLPRGMTQPKAPKYWRPLRRTGAPHE